MDAPLDRETPPLPVTDFVVESQPVRWREVLAVIVLVVLSDLAIYRGQGYAGYAVLFALAPLCLAWGTGSGRKAIGWSFAALLLLLAGRLVWCGSVLAVVCGFFCVVALAMCLTGRVPQILSMIAYSGQSFTAGAVGLNAYGAAAHRHLQPLKTSTWIAVVMPAGALMLFGTVFLMANPDLVAWVSQEWQAWFDRMSEWLIHFSILEIPFWIAAAWISVGLLRPLSGSGEARRRGNSTVNTESQSAALFAAFRNTLLTVIVLFVVYLGFEFQTLWFRTFPKGFHYSGYAHEGAAWLTVALAMATLTLSLIFRGQVLLDRRLSRLKQLAWVWSVLNLLLAVAVYNRLWIYVGFNGLTRMRMVAFFGTTAVVIGFLLAVYKIARHRDFVWLLRSDLWALALTIIAYALTPIDLIVMRYNTQRILAGDPAPSVQITVHPIDAEGLRELLPLLNCENELIRDGIRALYARQWMHHVTGPANREITNWEDASQLQFAERWLVTDLKSTSDQWALLNTDSKVREQAWERFREYAYQWY
ncbi:DUF4173 domain-containing protein [bacterium]|nr:DUF4173 domain-containing protein [bacterium]